MLRYIIAAIIIITILLIACTVLIFGSVNTYVDSKYEMCNRVNPKHRIPQDIATIDMDVEYPVVLKPNIKAGCGTDVKLVHDAVEYKDYFNNFDWSCDDSIIVSKYIKADREIGVLVERDSTGNFKVINAISKTPTKTNTPLDQMSKCTDRNSCSAVSLSSAAQQNIIDDLEYIIAGLSEKLNVAKLDILYNTDTDLDEGHYHIIEVNGVLGYCDYTGPNRWQLDHAKWALRWVAVRFKFGLANLLTGNASLTDPKFTRRFWYIWLKPRLYLFVKDPIKILQ